MNNQDISFADISEVPISRNLSSCGNSPTIQDMPLIALYKNALEKISGLEKQLEYLTGVMVIMKEDLQVLFYYDTLTM